jgi:hypothetical protein
MQKRKLQEFPDARGVTSHAGIAVADVASVGEVVLERNPQTIKSVFR